MGATPGFKVYDADGTYQAAVRDSTLAAAVVTMLPGGCVKWGGRIVWREATIDDKGRVVRGDGFASESYDDAAELMEQRISARQMATLRRRLV